jgi:hypothetical protein
MIAASAAQATDNGDYVVFQVRDNGDGTFTADVIDGNGGRATVTRKTKKKAREDGQTVADTLNADGDDCFDPCMFDPSDCSGANRTTSAAVNYEVSVSLNARHTYTATVLNDRGHGFAIVRASEGLAWAAGTEIGDSMNDQTCVASSLLR